MEKGFNKRKNESHNQTKIKGIYSTASAREKSQSSGNILQGQNCYGFSRILEDQETEGSEG